MDAWEGSPRCSLMRFDVKQVCAGVPKIGGVLTGKQVSEFGRASIGSGRSYKVVSSMGWGGVRSAHPEKSWSLRICAALRGNDLARIDELGYERKEVYGVGPNSGSYNSQSCFFSKKLTSIAKASDGRNR